MYNLSFTPLFWFGVIVGFVAAIASYGVIKTLIWLASHLQWI